MIKFDTYSLKARIFPAFLSIILPIMVFNHFYTSEEFAKFVNGVLWAKIASNLTISTICLFFLSEVGRIISKNFFEKDYFKDEREMPTTNYLMFSNDTYTTDYKIKIRKKILSDFKINLLSAEEESMDEAEARCKIVETMALIRKKLMKNAFLLQHNIEYGFMRNFIGGSVVGFLLSLSNIAFFNWLQIDLAVYISIFLLLVYSVFLIFRKSIITFYGNAYARILIREYVGVWKEKD